MREWDQQASSYRAIGRRLSHLRHALGLSQRQLADRLNISGPRWANYELGTSRIPVDLALRLVEYWAVSLDWIYYGNTAMMPEDLLAVIRTFEAESGRVSAAARAQRPRSRNG